MANKRLLVFAGTVTQAKAYIDGNKIKGAIIVHNQRSVIGLSPGEFEARCTGTWNDNLRVTLAHEEWQKKVSAFNAQLTGVGHE